MTAKATALLQKGRTLPEGGRWRGIATVGLLRLEYQSGQYEPVFAEYKRSKDQVPEEVRAEMMLLAREQRTPAGSLEGSGGDLCSRSSRNIPIAMRQRTRATSG